MILESEMDEDSVVKEIMVDFCNDHFPEDKVISDKTYALIHDAVSYAVMHAMLTLIHGKAIRNKRGKEINRAYYTMQELLEEATNNLGLDD